MSKKKKLIPKLRFPEFKNEEGWEEKPLEDICKLVRGPFGGSLKKEIFVKEGYAVYEQSHAIYSDFSYYRYRIDEEKFSELKRFSVKSGDIIMSCSGTMGKFALIPKEYEEGVINQALLKITTKQDYDNLFIKISLETNDNQNRLLSQSAGGAIKNVVSVSQIRELSLAIPNSKEQQKIASCLSSLDEVIASYTEKLDLLKDHKKGLMQNLFPQEGEKVPKYRFKEFEKDGEWVEKKLSKIGKPLMCKRIFKEQTTPNPERGIPFYKIGTFGKEADSYIPIDLYNEFKSKYNFPNKGDILISASGTIGRLVVYDGEPAYFQDSNIVWLGNNEKRVTNEFLFFCYSMVNWQTSDGGVIRRLYNSDLKNMEISYPENKQEQKKIASCLSSLDALITAQEKKIEELMQHKKGLMQGLFPKIID